MALMLGALYDALIAADAPPDKAQTAAAEAGGYQSRLSRVRSDLALLKWMVGSNTAMLVAMLTILLRDMIA